VEKLAVALGFLESLPQILDVLVVFPPTRCRHLVSAVSSLVRLLTHVAYPHDPHKIKKLALLFNLYTVEVKAGKIYKECSSTKTRRRSAMEKERFYKALLDNLYDGVYFVDRDRKITYWNKAAEHITGYKAEDILGRPCYDNILRHVTPDGEQLCLGECPFEKTKQDGKMREAHVFLHHKEGFRLPVWVRTAPIRDEAGNIIGAVEVFNSEKALSKLRLELQELRRTVLMDSLTEVWNRTYLERRLRGLIAEYQGQEREAGVAFVDIDHFKQVNDTYGHNIGDKVLKMVAATLRYSLRDNDVVGRWGGEEFLIILYDVDSLNSLRNICEKLRTLVQFSTIELEGKGAIGVTVSIGATLLQPNDTPETIVNRANGLMYRSKQSGRNRVTVG